MKSDDLIYGARSGIQKAIRRGDLDLAKTCFDLLWSESKHRNWLKWRLPVLGVEECFHLSGEVAKLVMDKDRMKDEKEMRKIVYRMVVSRKARDAVGLSSMRKLKDRLLHDEMVLASKYFPKDEKDIDFRKLSASLKRALKRKNTFSEYEKSTLGMMEFRANIGGMVGDRIMMLMGMILVATRGLDEEKVREIEQEDLKKYKVAKPKTIEMPWYVFDRHTQVGKIVLGIFTKKYGERFELDKDELWTLFFNCESAKVPDDKISLIDITENPKTTDSMWWGYYLKRVLEGNGRSVEESKRLWKDSISPIMEELTQWLLEARSNS